MVKVAVAGGTGSVGLHIVEAILATRKHEVVVLSRQPSSPHLAKLGVVVHQVSYDDPAALVRALAGVHTVISTISGYDKKTLADTQIALLDAAVQVGAKRFAPSEFSVRPVPNNPIEVWSHKYTVLEAVRRSGLEYTIFEAGVFTNYLGEGTPGLGHLRPLKVTFDVEHCKMTIPGDGSAAIVMTRVEDVGRFVAASLDLKTWPEFSQMRGDRKTLNEILCLAESVRGSSSGLEALTVWQRLTKRAGRKFDVTYLSLAEIEKAASAPTFSKDKFFGQWFLRIVKENFLGYEGANLNALLPQIRPVNIEDSLKEWWGKA